jgi:hypothetical protein
MDDQPLSERIAPVSEFFDYIEQLVFEVESGRIRAQDVPGRLRSDWGGVRVMGYYPKRDDSERDQVRELVSSGIDPRKARRIVRGK